MQQIYHTAINWLDYAELKALLEGAGIAVNPGESEDELREAVRANVLDNTIPKSAIDTSKVPSRPFSRY